MTHIKGGHSNASFEHDLDYPMYGTEELWEIEKNRKKIRKSHKRNTKTFDDLKNGGNSISSSLNRRGIDFMAAIEVETLSEEEEGAEYFGLFGFLNNESLNIKGLIDQIIPYAILVLFLAYLLAVIFIQSKIQKIAYWCSGDGLLYVFTLLVGIALLYFKIIKRFYGKWLEKHFVDPVSTQFSSLWSHWWFPWTFAAVLIAAVITYLIIDTAGERRRLVSIIGLFFIIGFAYVFSHAPRKVKWRHIFWGVSMQFVIALLVLRWPLGNSILQCFSDKVAQFLGFANEGASFVFGVLAQDPYNIFAFAVLPVTIFFSFFTSILYYLGTVQWIVVKLGWFFQITIGTTLCESMNASASIFLGMTESPLLIKPYLSLMTKSELHAIMTAGFATIAGSLLAAYVALGVDPALLITACFMNAPAALAISKLFYPELEKTRISAEKVKSLKSEEVNALHAGCVGVSNAIPLVANIAANLIAFIAFIAFFNSVFDWSCQLVNIAEGQCTLESVFGYIFMPLAWMMGVEWKDCYNVGSLIGIKISVNEFVAYSALSDLMEEGALTPRSQAIATFALCGFSNISSIGIMLGGLGPMAPERRNDMAKIALRAMIAGSMATLTSACVAGMLLTDEILSEGSFTTEPSTTSYMSTAAFKALIATT